MPLRPAAATSRARAGARICAVLVVGLVWGLLGVVVSPVVGVPAFGSTLAGASSAAMYPSGGEFDPVGDRLVVADTGLDRVLFYSRSGERLGGFGGYGSGPGEFASPRDVAVDDVGNIYVADAENNRVQAFTPGGVFRWERGGLGGGPGSLNTPIGVTWDGANDVLLVASTGQSLVKAWDADGVFQWRSPAAGELGARAMRDVSRGPDGRMWVTAYREHQIKVYDVTPAGVWVDADPGTPGVDPVWVLGDGATNGRGVGQMNFPYNVAWSPDGSVVYVSDTGNGRITRWDVSGDEPVWLEPFGGRCAAHPQPCADPPVDAGKFNHLRRVMVDPAGLVYGADFWGGGFEVFAPDGSVAGSIEGAEAPAPGFAEAFGVDVAPDGQVYVMDRLNHRIQRFAADGSYVNRVGARGTQPGTFSWPEAVTVAPDGRVWGVDTRGGRILDFPADLATTPVVRSHGSTGAGVGQLNYPSGADVGPDGVVYVADTRNHRIQTFDPVTGRWTVLAGTGSAGSGPGEFTQPMGVAVTADAVFVADTLNHRVQKLTLAGAHVATFATGLSGPEGIEVAPDGTVWVADTQNHRVVHLSGDLVDLGDGFGAPGTGEMQFDRPHDVAVGNGHLYVADTYNSRVQVYDLSGGEEPPPPPPGEPSYAGQIAAAGGVAPVYPAGVAIADERTWFVADSAGSRVVSIDPVTDQVNPVAATGLTDPRDLELDVADPTRLWVTDTGGNRVVPISRTGVVGSPVLGGLNQPYGLANDTDRVYVANTYGHQVRAYDKSDGSTAWTRTACAGTAFSRPRDVGVGGDGEVLVADTDNDRIVRLDPATGECLGAFGSRGTGPGAFRSPRSVTPDGAGGLWVADALNYRVQHLSGTGAFLGATPVDAYGTGPAQFRSPHCVAVVPGTTRVAVCDTFNYRISVYDGAPTTPALVETIAGTPPAPGGFNGPFGVAYGPDGELYVADWFNHRIQKFTPEGTFERQWGGYGPREGSLIFPRNVLVGPDGNVVVTDSENNRISIFTPRGDFVRQVRPPAGNALSRPHQVAPDGAGGYWVADTNNNRIVHLGPTGTVQASFTPTGTNPRPAGIVLDTDNTLVVSNTGGNRVERYTTNGTLITTLLGPAQVNRPASLLLTGTGTATRLWVTDYGNNRIHVLDDTGALVQTFPTTNGPGRPNGPRGIAHHPPTNTTAIADHHNNRITLWTTGTTPTDTMEPQTTVTEPAAGATVNGPTVTLRGSATDNVAVAGVRVNVRDRNSGLWLQADGSWSGRAGSFRPADLSDPGAASTEWSLDLDLPAGDYGFSFRAEDTSGLLDTSPSWRTFQLRTGPPDTADPETRVTEPAANATVRGPVITLAGHATDDVGVAAVRIGVRDRNSGLWLQDDGSWSERAGAFRRAGLSDPGASSTDWGLEIALPVGDYGFYSRAEDTSGRLDRSQTWRTFQVRSGDTTPADGTMTRPANNATVPMGPVTLRGGATDDSAVGSVRIAIQDSVTKEWLRPDGTFAAGYAAVPGTLTTPGAAATEWTFVFDPPAAKKYGVSVIAADLDGNVDPSKPWRTFTVAD